MSGMSGGKRNYQIGDRVQVNLGDAWYTGVVRGYAPDTFAGDPSYRVDGDKPRRFLTHTTERGMRRCES